LLTFTFSANVMSTAGTMKGRSMKMKSTAIAAIVVGCLMGGIGATPAMASGASQTTVVASSGGSGSIEVGRPSSEQTLRPNASGSITTPFIPEQSVLPPESSPRWLPALLAVGRAFVAAVRVVPPAYAKLAPAVRAGASAVGTYVKKQAPAAAKAIVSGVAVSALYDILKKIFGF
jgi:hypothetical protein